MAMEDLWADTRHTWLWQEQQPRVVEQTQQSNFEQSPCYRICLAIATIVIGIQVFSPNPDAPVEHAPNTVQTGHVRPMV